MSLIDVLRWLFLTKMITVEDFFQNYSGAFVRLSIPKFDELVVARLDSLDTLNRPHRLVFSTEKLGEVRIQFNGKIVPQVELPPVGFFNHEKQVMQLMRLTPRVRTRGFSQGNVFISSPEKQLIDKLSAKPHPSGAKLSLSFPIVENAFKGNFVTSFHHAIYELKNKKQLGIALSRKFWLAQPIQPKQGYALMTMDLCHVGQVPMDETSPIEIFEPYQREVSLWLESFPRS